MPGVRIPQVNQHIATPTVALRGGSINAPEVSQVGNALANLGGAIQQFTEARQQEQASAYTADALASHQLEAEQARIEEQNNATNGGAGVTLALKKRLDAMTAARIKAAPNRVAQAFLRDRLAAANAGTLGQAMQYEDIEGKRYTIDLFDKAGDKVAEASAMDPGQMPVRLAEQEQAIANAHGITPDMRRTATDATRQKTYRAVTEATLTRDPAQVQQFLRRSIGLPDGTSAKDAKLSEIIGESQAILADGGTQQQADEFFQRRLVEIGGTKGESFDITDPGTVPRWIAELPMPERVAYLKRAENESEYRAGRDTANAIWQASGGRLDAALSKVNDMPDAKLADDVERRIRNLAQDQQQAHDLRRRDVSEGLVAKVQSTGFDSLTESERSAAAQVGITPELHRMEADRIAGRGAITDPAVEGMIITTLRDPAKFDKLDLTKPMFLRGLSTGDRLRYQQLQNERRAQGAAGTPLLSADAKQQQDMIDQHIRIDLGLDPKVRDSAKPDDLAARNRALNYTGKMQAAIDLWARQNNGKRPDVTTLRKLSDQLLLQIPVEPLDSPGAFDPKGDTVRSFEAEKIRSVDQVPQRFRADIAKRLQDGGVPLTDANVLRYYVDAVRMGVLK